MYDNTSVITMAHAVDALNQKKIVVYPTESVFGLGCDPDSEVAVSHLLKIKKRPIEKGLILIAADYDQLRPYIDDVKLTQLQRNIIFSKWPGSVTFIFPAKKSTPRWLTGCFNSLAIRITNHPLIIALCRAFGKPIISTSANLHGETPCRTVREISLQFGGHFPILKGETGRNKNPSEIRDAFTSKCIRYG